MQMISRFLKVRSGQRAVQGAADKPVSLIISDLLKDITFFMEFIIYPGVSTGIFMFFMKETFDGPGEDGVTVMRYDRSIETDSALYNAFIPYALVMMALYPSGIPLQVECTTFELCRVTRRHALDEGISTTADCCSGLPLVFPAWGVSSLLAACLCVRAVACSMR